MTEPAFLAAVRRSYDTVAEDYATLVPPRFATDPLGRGMLAAFAELVRANGGQPVAGDGHLRGAQTRAVVTRSGAAASSSCPCSSGVR